MSFRGTTSFTIANNLDKCQRNILVFYDPYVSIKHIEKEFFRYLFPFSEFVVHIKGTDVLLDWKWRGNIDSIIQRFLLFFNSVVLVQYLTMLKLLFTYDALKSNLYP